MKQRVIFSIGLAVLVGVWLVTPALAIVNIDWMPVGNADNAPDTTGYGSVGYAYQIGKYEVTNAQYAEFLNTKARMDNYLLYNSSMASYGITQNGGSGNFTYSVTSGLENRPVVYVSWFDSARFANWLGNGQGSGDTETGAYTLISGQTAGIVTVNPVANIYIPSENEWYKAAYYDPNKGGAGVGGYWTYPTQSDTLGGNTVGVANSANYWDGNYAKDENGLSSNLTNVGAYGANSESFYGTNDQAGNVYEWNDTVISSSRGLRGGAWNGDGYALLSSYRFGSGYGADPRTEGEFIGFRVASVPEPTSSVLTMLAGGMLLIRRKR